MISTEELIKLASGRMGSVKDGCEVVSDWFRLDRDSDELQHIAFLGCVNVQMVLSLLETEQQGEMISR